MSDSNNPLTPRINEVEKQFSKNLLINGNMEFAQRNPAASAVGGYSSLDRWYFLAGGTMGRVSVAGELFKYALEITSTGGNHFFSQRIESIFTTGLVGKQFTVSCKIKLVSGDSFAPELGIKYPNAQDDWTTDTTVSVSLLDENDGSLDGSFKVFSKTFTITQNMADNGFSITLGDISGPGGTSTVQYSQSIVNEGSEVLPFQRAGRNYVEELQLCQRYYEKSYNIDTPVATSTNIGCAAFGEQLVSSTYRVFSNQFKVTKRAVPIIGLWDLAGNTSKFTRVTGSSGTSFVTTDNYTMTSYSFLTYTGESAIGLRFGSNDNIGGILFHWSADAEL